MMVSATWDVLPSDPRGALALAHRCGVEPLIGQLLLNRGVCDAEGAQRFLSPKLSALGDPMVLPDMPRAVARVRKAISRQEPVLVFGDSDVDGITAAVIVSESLTAAGARVLVRVSNRLTGGYGFPPRLIARLKRLGIGLLVLVDCGTNQQQEIRELAGQGIETIVLDHHVPSASVAKPEALVNPHCADASGRPQTASFGTPIAHPADGWVPGLGRELCSAGLALKLAQALWPDDPERIEPYLELAALGTLADYSPLVGDNRILVSEGTARLAATKRPGLARLCAQVRLTKATPEQILQRLVPRLNAAGRMGDAKPVWRLLVERTSSGVERFAGMLGEAHDRSKALSRRILAEAHELANRMSFKEEVVMVVGRQGWHPGLMGPVAAQLAGRFGRPAIAIAFGGRLGVGSGRSPSAFNLLDALRACEGMLLRYGGHPQACGLTIQAAHLDGFRESINHHARASLAHRTLVPRLRVDAETSLGEVTPQTVAALPQFRPFGPGNPAPLLLVRRLEAQAGRHGAVWLSDGRGRVRTKGRVGGLVSGCYYDVVGMPGASDDGVAWSLRDARICAAAGRVTAL